MRAFWSKNCYEKNTELCFTTKLEKSEKAEIRIIAKDVYNLFINGVFVHYGPARAAKGYARIDCVQIGEYLTQEENTIFVYVQANCTRSLCFAQEKPLFGAEIYMGGRLYCDASGFECFKMTDKLSKVEKMSSQRGYLEIYKMAGSREQFITLGKAPKLQLTEVPAPFLLDRNVTYAKNQEKTAVFYEEGGVLIDETRVWKNDFTDLMEGLKGTWDGYYRRECEELLSQRLQSFVFNKEEKNALLTYRAYVFERVYCGKFKLKVKALKSSQLYLIYDDYLIDGKIKFNREQIIHGLKWTLAPGEYEIYSGEVYTAKYLWFVVDGEIEIEGVSVVCIENAETDGYTLSCEDVVLQKIADAALHSFQQNAYDIFTDCPSRERAGWLCDSFFTAKAERFFTGGNKVEKNFLENYALYQNEHFDSDGILPMCYPSDPKDKYSYIPNWILWYVIELEDRTKRTGECSLSYAEREKINDVLAFFEKHENEYGLLENLEGWLFLEWSKANDFLLDVNFPSNMLYCGALRSAGRLLKDKRLVQKAKTLQETILKMSFNGTFFADNAVRENGKLIVQDNVSETCQYFAAYFDILTREENPAFYQRIFEGFSPSRKENTYPNIATANMFMGYVLRLTLLDRECEYARILEECKSVFAGMANATSTIWELFGDNASCNHGFGSIVGVLIAKALVGLVAIDETEQTLTFAEADAGVDVRLEMPITGEKLVVEIRNGVRKIYAPKGYQVKMKQMKKEGR
jgi:alpha-L-rhamnosidase